MAADPTRFHFRQRSGRIDWMKLGAVDVDKLSTSVDVATLNDNVDHIAFAQVTNEDVRQFHSGNFIKLFRMCQLIIEYLLHVQDALAAEVKERSEERHEVLRELQVAQEHIRNKDAQLHAAKRELKYNRKVLRAYEKQASHSVNPKFVPGQDPEMYQGGLLRCMECNKHLESVADVTAHFQRRHPGMQPNYSHVRPQSAPGFGLFGADGFGHGISGVAGGVDDQQKQSFAQFVVKAMGKQLDDWGYEFQQQIERRVVNAVRNNQISGGSMGDDFMQADRFNRLEAELQGYQRQVLSAIAQQEAMAHRRGATGPLTDLSHQRAQQMEQQRIEDQLQEILRRQSIESQELQALVRHSTGRIVTKVDAIADDVARRRLTDARDERYHGLPTKEISFEPGRRMKELGLTPAALLAGKAGLKTGGAGGLFSPNSRNKRGFGTRSRSAPGSPTFGRRGILRSTTPQPLPSHANTGRNTIPTGNTLAYDETPVGGHGHAQQYTDGGNMFGQGHGIPRGVNAHAAELLNKKPVYPVMEPTSVPARFPHKDHLVRETAENVKVKADHIEQSAQYDNLIRNIQVKRGDGVMQSIEQRADSVTQREFQPSPSVRQELNRFAGVKAARTVEELSVPLALQQQELQRNIENQERQRAQQQQQEQQRLQQQQEEERRRREEEQRRQEQRQRELQQQQQQQQNQFPQQNQNQPFGAPQQNQQFGQPQQNQGNPQQPNPNPNQNQNFAQNQQPNQQQANQQWSNQQQQNDRFQREQEEKRQRGLAQMSDQQWQQQQQQNQPNRGTTQNQPFDTQQQPRQQQQWNNQPQQQPQAPPRQSRQPGATNNQNNQQTFGGSQQQMGGSSQQQAASFGGVASSSDGLPPLNNNAGGRSPGRTGLAPLDTGGHSPRVRVDAPNDQPGWGSSTQPGAPGSNNDVVSPFSSNNNNNNNNNNTSTFRPPAGAQPTPFTAAASGANTRGFSGPKALGTQSSGTVYKDGIPVRNNKVLLDEIEPEQEEPPSF